MSRFFQLLAILALITHVKAHYDFKKTREYWYINAASYCNPSRILNWDCGKPC